jgi:hypothetical protein
MVIPDAESSGRNEAVSLKFRDFRFRSVAVQVAEKRLALFRVSVTRMVDRQRRQYRERDMLAVKWRTSLTDW